MAESTKSVSEIQDSISDHVQEVNKTVASATKGTENLAKNLVAKESVALKAFKNQAEQDLKHMQQDYIEKEETVLKILKPQKNSFPYPRSKPEEVAKEYERILQENVDRLREIAQQDFKTSNSNYQKLIEETKEKLHDFIYKTFGDHPAKDDFAKTAGTIFAKINARTNEKITKDLSSKSTKYSNVFVCSLNKPPEQIEAERMLHEQFEEELLGFNAQIKDDFEEMSNQILKLVDDTKTKIGTTIQLANETIKTSEFKHTSDLPPSTTIEQNINNLLNKAGLDIQQAKEKMTKDVTENKDKINDNAKYYAEKMLGKNYFDPEED